MYEEWRKKNIVLCVCNVMFKIEKHEVTTAVSSRNSSDIVTCVDLRLVCQVCIWQILRTPVLPAVIIFWEHSVDEREIADRCSYRNLVLSSLDYHIDSTVLNGDKIILVLDYHKLIGTLNKLLIMKLNDTHSFNVIFLLIKITYSNKKYVYYSHIIFVSQFVT